MDHGSKLQASNERLGALAQRMNMSPPMGISVVKHAHMEIASPGLMEVTSTLAEDGVKRVIVHPLFISPAGKHVTQDIPKIVDEVKSSLGVDLVLTEAYGSDLDLLKGGVERVVERYAGTQDNGMGMFGEIMELMNEAESS